MTSDLQHLLSKLEAAEGPNYKLDFEIWCAAHGHTPNWDTGSGLGWYVPKGCDHVTLNDYWPAYTASLDAAVGLVPEGWSYQLYGPDPLMRGDHPNRVGQPYCILGLPGSAEADGRAVTLPLALCIAALKAREQQDG